MERCEHLDEENDICMRCGQEMPAEDVHQFCDSNVSCEQCPIYCGEPILTQAVSHAIESEFSRLAAYTTAQLREMKLLIGGISRQALMLSIDEICVYADNYQIYFPDASGLYLDTVRLSSEKEIARALEDSLNCYMYEMLPKPVYSRVDCDTPNVSVGEFDQMDTYVSNRGLYVTNSWSCFSTTLTGKEVVFEEPAKQLAGQIYWELSKMIGDLLNKIDNARDTFERSVRSAQSGASSFSGNILSNVPFDWHFYNY